MSAASSSTDPVARAEASAGRSTLRQYLRNPLGVVALVVFLLLVLVAVIAPLIAMHNPNAVNLNIAYAPPSWHHLLGGDETGRDEWARLVYGTRTTLLGTLIAVVSGVLLGVTSGLAAGYYGGIFDSISSWISNALQSIPGMIVLLVVADGSHDNFTILMITIGVFMAPGYFRIARSGTLVVRSEAYVDAARVAGISDLRIIAVHVLRAVAAQLIIQTALTAGIGIGIQAGLQFLGIGSATTPSWGQMIASAFATLPEHQFLLIPPVVALALSVASLALIGSTLADATGSSGRAVVKRAKLRRQPQTATAEPMPAPPANVALQVSGLRVSYAKSSGDISEVVRGVDLSVRHGEVLGVVGESGSGKSQTVFSILDLLPAGGLAESSGIWLADKNIAGLDRRKRRQLLGREIGYVPQEPMSNLDPCYTIGHQLCEPLRAVLGLSRTQAKARALELLSRVGIKDPERVLGCYPHQIPGGMAQRVLIAGAIAARPQLLVADEPTTALDVTVQAEVLELLRELQQEYGMALVLVTHNFGVVADICDRVVVMRDGRVVEEGDVNSVFQSPADPYTAELIAANLDGALSRTDLYEEFAAIVKEQIA